MSVMDVMGSWMDVIVSLADTMHASRQDEEGKKASLVWIEKGRVPLGFDFFFSYRVSQKRCR